MDKDRYSQTTFPGRKAISYRVSYLSDALLLNSKRSKLIEYKMETTQPGPPKSDDINENARLLAKGLNQAFLLSGPYPT
jgi:hypothetical protein